MKFSKQQIVALINEELTKTDKSEIKTLINKELDKELEQIKDTYMSGSLSDMEHHKYLQGKLEEIYNIQDFIKNYFNRES